MDEVAGSVTYSLSLTNVAGSSASIVITSPPIDAVSSARVSW